MRSIIVGDVHGCYREMMEILSRVGPSSSDKVYFIGDIINKGPDSKKVIEEIIKQGFSAILGNHEWSYLKRWFAKKKPSPFDFLYRSKKYPLLDNLMKELNEEENQWLVSLPFYISTSEFLLVHAGVFPQRPLHQHDPLEILNVRTIKNRPWHEYYQEDRLILYGHWAQQGLTVKENSIGLDSGCVYGGKLSAVILPQRKIVQVNSKTSTV